MLLIWTKNSSLISKFIRWISGEPASHFAVVFDSKLVFHSNLAGVGLAWFPTFTQSQTIVATIKLDLELETEESFYHGILNAYSGKAYDFGALIYFLIKGLQWKFASKPLPTQNMWADSDAYLCTEIAKCLPLSTINVKLPEHLDMVTPWQLYQIISLGRARLELTQVEGGAKNVI